MFDSVSVTISVLSAYLALIGVMVLTDRPQKVIKRTSETFRMLTVATLLVALSLELAYAVYFLLAPIVEVNPELPTLILGAVLSWLVALVTAVSVTTEAVSYRVQRYVYGSSSQFRLPGK